MAALEDKIVQRALVTVLNEVYEADFSGSRKERGAGKPETFDFSRVHTHLRQEQKRQGEERDESEDRDEFAPAPVLEGWPD